MRTNNLQKLIDKYSENITLKDLQNALQKEQESRDIRKQNIIDSFKEEYLNKYLKIKENNRFIEDEFYLIHVQYIEFESLCEDMETLCFEVKGEKIQTMMFPSVSQRDDIRLYSNLEYETISEEEYNNVKNIVNKYVEEIKELL